MGTVCSLFCNSMYLLPFSQDATITKNAQETIKKAHQPPSLNCVHKCRLKLNKDPSAKAQR